MIALARAELLKLRSTRTALGLFIVILVVTLLPLVLLIALLPEDWLAADGDLERMDPGELRRDFASVRRELEQSSERLFKNFLRISCLLR